MAAIEWEMYFWIQVCDGICLRRSKSICLPSFDVITQSTAELKLLADSENGRLPFWIFTILNRCRHKPDPEVHFRFYGRHLEKSIWRYTPPPMSSAKFRSSPTIVGGVTTLLSFFFKMATGSHIRFDLGNVSAIAGPQIRSWVLRPIPIWQPSIFRNRSGPISHTSSKSGRQTDFHHRYDVIVAMHIK